MGKIKDTYVSFSLFRCCFSIRIRYILPYESHQMTFQVVNSIHTYTWTFVSNRSSCARDKVAAPAHDYVHKKGELLLPQPKNKVHIKMEQNQNTFGRCVMSHGTWSLYDFTVFHLGPLLHPRIRTQPLVTKVLKFFRMTDQIQVHKQRTHTHTQTNKQTNLCNRDNGPN